MRFNPIAVLVLAVAAILASIWKLAAEIAAFSAARRRPWEPWERVWYRGELRPVPAGGAKAGDLDVKPGLGRFRAAWSYFWRGGIGGSISGLGQAMGLGPAGPVASGLLAATVMGGDAGKAVAAIAGYEAAKIIFIGDGIGTEAA